MHNRPHRPAAAPGVCPGSFQPFMGLPSLLRYLSNDERLGHEELLVDTLRGYAMAAAHTAHRFDPAEYEDFVYAITARGAGETTPWSSRLPSLLQAYAEFIPGPECEFLHVSAICPAWKDRAGRVVLDVLTTALLVELAADEVTGRIEEATDMGLDLVDGRLSGVRLLVLDSLHESMWHPVRGVPRPL